ncbi:LIM domain-containing protein [Loa loa]|uniref:LIM domain-containing protein n=1 Tax=Loa loa TaxID=7209 RepID=A0A1I7VS82_LOALO|nr:LIM domain-containing protein [Loa loa]EFO20318.2 LIM domain-containing protein [Loa loa]
MTDVELETRNFLRELDTFGQPPPPQRLISDADSKTMSKEFELKLHHINLEKQKHVQNGTWNSKPGTSFSSKSSTSRNSNGNPCSPAESNNENKMSKREIGKLKEQVVSASRPLNPWYEHQHQSPTLSANFVRNTFRKDLSDEEKHSSAVVRKTPIQYHHTNVATVSGENTVFGVVNTKKLNCAQNIASISPTSASSNTETSHSSISTGGFSMKSVNESSIDRNERLLMNGNTAKKGINDVHLNANHQLPSTNVPNKYDDKQPKSNATVIPPWRKKSMDSVTSTDSGISVQRKKYDEITNNLEKQLNLNRKPIGICELCGKAILEEMDATCALGQLYHQNCFTCDMCGRTLRGKRFYKARGKKYCEEDYLYSGMHETAERCAACSHFIMDMVLQALGKSYHPRCFRCEKCKSCLDGVPFALDPEGHVYCTEDYHRLFAPKCAACLQAIMPNKETGETVHVVAINRDYHIECYVCKGCGMQLTDEPEKRCYPLNDHLLCKSCHIHWVRTGGDSKPITDL